jgi:hypothetical protein
MMGLTRRTGFDNQPDAGAQPFGHQMVMHGRGRQQGGDRHMVAIDLAVGDDQDARSRCERGPRPRHTATPDVPRRLHCPRPAGSRYRVRRNGTCCRCRPRYAQLCHVVAIEHRLGDFQTVGRVDFVDAEQIRLGADEGYQRHHQLLADRVDRRIGHLREELPEIVEQRLALVRQHRQRRIVAHRAGGLLAGGGHRFENELDVFLAVAEGLLPVEQRCRVGRRRDAGFGTGRLVELDVDAAEPVLVGLGSRQRLLEFRVVDDASLVEVDEEHLARLQAPLLDDFSSGIGRTPASEAITTRSSSVTR